MTTRADRSRLYLLACAILYCGSLGVATAAPGASADQVFVHAAVYTQDPTQPWVESFPVAAIVGVSSAVGTASGYVP